jgi:hypothetical protein
MRELRTLHLPEELCKAAEGKWMGRFKNLEDLLSFVLQELNRGEALELDKAEEQMIEQRLRDLGYI